MAHAVKRANITYDNMASYIDSLGCPLVTKLDNTSISIDGHAVISFANQNDTIAYNGGTVYTMSVVQEPRQMITVWDNNLFYYQLYYSYNGARTRSAFVYEKNAIGTWSGYKYVGWTTYDVTFFSLTDIPIWDMNDLTQSGYYKSAINYGVTPGSIDYVSSSIIISNTLFLQSTDTFLSCSTQTPNQVVTFNSNNYYTIGTNSLILLDRN